MYHVDRDGKQIPIAAMTDEHLINTIKLFSQPMIEATNNITSNSLQSKRSKALYGSDVLSPKAYKSMYITYLNNMGPYIIEATLRGLDIKETLHGALGRSSQDLEAPRVCTNSIMYKRKEKAANLAIAYGAGPDIIDSMYAEDFEYYTENDF